MTRDVIELSSEEAAAILTCLEYYILYDLQNKDKHQRGLLSDYVPMAVEMARTLNELREKLLPIVKGLK